MHWWNRLWNSLDSTRRIHSQLEFWAIAFFVVLVAADTFAHVWEQTHPERSRRVRGIGLFAFAFAVVMELVAYPFGQRNDTLANERDAVQRASITILENSTQQLKTEAETAEARIADAEARARTAEAQVAAAKAESKAASVKAEGFRLDIAKANERAAEATKTAEADRLARLKMEQELKARSLTTEQQKKIVVAIKPFAGAPYEIAVNASAEPLHLVEQIDSVLRSAGWNPKDSALTNLRFTIKLSTGTRAEQTLSTGVSIQLTKTLNEKYGKAAEALISAFRMEGIPATGSYLPDTDGSPNNVHVVVGSQELIN